MKSQTQKEIIEKIPPLEWGKSGETSFIASVNNIMKSLGVNTSYAELMVFSGAAFRMQLHEEWCPSSGDWYDRSHVLHHLGYTTKHFAVQFDPESDVDEKFNANL